MSSLFADAMRAAVFCNASGAAPWIVEQIVAAEAARVGLCEATLELDENWFDCQLPAEHEGMHIAKGDNHGQGWELRWA